MIPSSSMCLPNWLCSQACQSWYTDHSVSFRHSLSYRLAAKMYLRHEEYRRRKNMNNERILKGDHVDSILQRRQSSHTLNCIFFTLKYKIQIYRFRFVTDTCHCRWTARKTAQDSQPPAASRWPTWSEHAPCWCRHSSEKCRPTSPVSRTSSAIHSLHFSETWSAPRELEIQWISNWFTKSIQPFLNLQ